MENIGHKSTASLTTACIFLDNFRLGGFQRLALDQAYELSDRGYSVNLYITSSPESWVMPRLESKFIAEKNIQVYETPISRAMQILFFWKQLSSIPTGSLFISHSLRATFSLRILKMITFRKFVISTTIHQLPRLSHLSQRFRRFIYGQFSDNLYCFSSAVSTDWTSQFGRTFSFFVQKFTRRISLRRNGVYLNRLPPVREQLKVKQPRLIYLGRTTFWKGLETILDLAREVEMSDFDFLMIVPDFSEGDFEEFSKILGDRLNVITGKTISDLEFRDGDVHVYPANYGSRVNIHESISLNCLEMASIGIPTLVTKGGLSTWPEIHRSNLIHEVDWAEKSCLVRKLHEVSALRISDEEIEATRRLFDIGNQFIQG